MADKNIVFDNISKVEAIGCCLILAISYVLVFYIKKSPYPRDHPYTVKQRCTRALGISILAPIFLRYISQESTRGVPLATWLGLHLHNIFPAISLPLFLTMILFSGPLTMMFLEKELPLMKEFSPSFNIISVRNLIVAPLTEELIYRGCMMPVLLPSFGITSAVLICPLLFGVAHIHHAFERFQASENISNIIIETAFQLSYTTLFGIYSAFIFVRTGHFIAPFICHSFCNYMGLPEFGGIPYTQYPKVVSAIFITGFVLFFSFLFPFTDPNIYDSVYFK